jgi:hypothetical protein
MSKGDLARRVLECLTAALLALGLTFPAQAALVITPLPSAPDTVVFELGLDAAVEASGDLHLDFGTVILPASYGPASDVEAALLVGGDIFPVDVYEYSLLFDPPLTTLGPGSFARFTLHAPDPTGDLFSVKPDVILFSLPPPGATEPVVIFSEVAAVPEPATALLLFGGVAVLHGWGVRRRGTRSG